MSQTIQIPVDDVIVGNRHRQEMGDIARLANSIADLGLLQAIGVDSRNHLVFGHRRLEACRSLGWETIPARVIDVPAILAERDENEVRKDFTPSERVAIGKEVEAFLGERRGRPSETNSKAEIVENFPQFESGQKTREVAAKAAGFGNGKTYQQAKQVVEQGTPELVKAMDQGDVSVSAAAAIAKLPEGEQQTIVAAGKDAMVERARQEREKATNRSGSDEPPSQNQPANVGMTEEMGGGIKAALAGFSGNNEWYTPAKWIEMARKAMGTIDIDPASCAVAQHTVNAADWFDQERDGLQHDWPGNVWLNPPYARGLIEEFIDRLVAQFQSGITKQAVVLVDNRTDTKWFHALCSEATAVAFTRGRVNFYNESVESSSPANGSVFVYLGQNWASFKRAFADDCLVLANLG